MDRGDPTKPAVVILSCTSTFSQFDVVGPEFQTMVASVRPVTPEEPPVPS